MGSAYSLITTEKHWYVYIRRLDTDAYEPLPIQTWKNISVETALSRFKHEKYAFAVGNFTYSANTKAVYLYYGSTRIVKIAILNNQVVVESEHKLLAFLEATEECSPGRAPKMQTPFERKWFKNYARLNVNSVCWVLNDRRSFAEIVKKH